jgi:hypothetical protein
MNGSRYQSEPDESIRRAIIAPTTQGVSEAVKENGLVARSQSLREKPFFVLSAIELNAGNYLVKIIYKFRD